MGEDIPEGVLPPVKDKTPPAPSPKNLAGDKGGAGDKVETKDKDAEDKDKAAENIKVENGGHQEEKEKEKALLEGATKVKEEPAEESQEKKSEAAKPAQTPNGPPKAAKEAKPISTPPVSNRPRRQVRKHDAENSNSK